MKFLCIQFLLVLPVLAQTQSPLAISNQRIDFESDALLSDDITVIKSGLNYEATLGSTTYGVTFGHTYHSVDYEPFSTTLSAKRIEDTYNYGFDVEHSFSSEWTGIASINLVDGFSTHRSIWISEFYDQFNGRNPAYERADPGSVAYSVGAQWNYAPNLGSVLVTAGYSQADIVPGWGRNAITELLEPTDSELDTYSGSIVWNAVVNNRWRTQQTLRVSRMESRELRFQAQSDSAFLISDRLTLRTQLGGAIEDPQFDAYFAGLTLVYDIDEHWQISTGLRFYEDTGEINPSNFNTSAPGVENTELSLSLLWTGSNTQVRGSLAFYDTDFDPVEPQSLNGVFANLYQDREFIAARIAVTHQF